MHTQVEEVRDQAACLLGGRAQLAPLHEVICAAGCSLVRAPPYLGGPMGLASSGGIFYWAPRMAGLACGGRIYPNPARGRGDRFVARRRRRARPRHRRRARSARRRWQPAAAPPGTQARSALGAQRRAPSAERVARGGDQACRRRRARSAHATGAERVARGGASWHAVAQPAQAAHAADAGRLLPASAALTTNIVVWPQTMSPAPGRRPPIYSGDMGP